MFRAQFLQRYVLNIYITNNLGEKKINYKMNGGSSLAIFIILGVVNFLNN